MKTTPTKITINSGIGLGAYILGSIGLMLAAFMFAYKAYVLGICIVIPALILVGFRMKVVLDLETMMITKKTGLFIPFITRIKRSMIGTSAIVLSRHPSHYNYAANMKASSSYSLELEHPAGNIPIFYYDDHQKGYDTGHDIAKWMQVKFYQNVVK